MSQWHFSDLLCVVIALQMLTFVFFYLWSVYRRRYLALWSLASATYLLQYAQYLLSPPTRHSMAGLFGFLLPTAVGALLLHAACRELIGRRVSRTLVALEAAALLLAAAVYGRFPTYLVATPPTLISAGLIIHSGFSVFRRVKGAPTGRTLMGWSLTGWGMMLASVPLFMLHPHQLPSGYAVAAMLFLAMGAGALILFFERRGEQLQAELADKEALLREKDVLLREVHHRVKNNLQIMRSLFSLQAVGCTGEAAGALDAAQGRIDSMAMIHEDFYQATGVTGIEIGRYVRRLLARLRAKHDPDGRIACLVEADALSLDVDRMVPVGQFLNEALTNALVHGLGEPDGGAELRIAVARRGGSVCIEIRDDGPGLPDDRTEGLGLMLLRSLADQLHGDVSFVNDGGLAVRLNFPAERGE